jgi:hypothetical protein
MYTEQAIAHTAQPIMLFNFLKFIKKFVFIYYGKYTESSLKKGLKTAICVGV